MKRSAVLLLLMTAGCSAGGGGPVDPGPLIEAPIKVTMFQFTFNQRRQPIPEYIVMLSRTWTLTYGGMAGEPFERYVRNPYKGTEIRDRDLDVLAKALVTNGWDDLPSFDLETLDQSRLAALEREMRSNPMAEQQYVYITLHTPTGKKTAFGKDALLAGPAVQAKFAKCREIVLMGRLQHTAQSTAVPKTIK
jgi:hypothetical protein